MEATINLRGYDVTISDADVVNVSEYLFYAEGSNPHNVRAWVALDYGFVLGMAFAECESDALDELADAGKLDAFLLSEEDQKDYDADAEGVDFLGNHGRPFDVRNVELFAIKLPKFSFCALLAMERLTCSHEGCTAKVPEGWRMCLNHAAVAQWKREGKL